MKLSLIAICALLAARAVAFGDPAVVKAKVEEPVVPELMGGCSLKCGFAWSVEVQPATGARPSMVKVLSDESPETAWIAANGTSGVGTKLKIAFPKKLVAEVEGEVPFYGLDLINGDWKSEEQWKVQGRVKKVRLSYNGKPLRDVVFADSRRWQRVTFPDIFVHSGDSLTLEILEIYPGEKGAGAAISEVVLQGAH